MARTFKKKSTRRKRQAGVFSGLGGVSEAYEKTNMEPGHHIGMIEKFIRGNRQVDSVEFIKIALVVLRDFDDGQVLVVQGHPKPHLAIGSTPAHIIIKNSKYDYHLRDLKNFLTTALGQSDDSVAEEAGKIWALIQEGKELPEDLAEYEEYVEDAENLDDVVNGVWDHMVDYAVSDEQPLAGFLIEWNSTSKVKASSRQVDDALLTDKDYVTNTFYKNSVDFSDAAELLSDEGMAVLRSHLPDLDERIAAEAAD